MTKQYNRQPGGPFRFWQRWLLYTSILFAGTGLLLAFGNNLPLFNPYYEALARQLFHQPMPAGVSRFRGFICGPLGGTITGFYVLQAFIAAVPFARKERWSWQAILVSTIAWCVTDSLICLYYGFWIQVYAINAFSVVVKLLPLAFTRRYFYGTSA